MWTLAGVGFFASLVTLLVSISISVGGMMTRMPNAEVPLAVVAPYVLFILWCVVTSVG